MSGRRTRIPAALALVLSWATLAPQSVQADDQAQVARGAYLAQIMDCGGCHTPGAMTGAPDFAKALSGGTVGFKLGDVGIFFPPNLTPSQDTGLGGWSA